MRYSYRLNGLSCAHCASVIEREVQGWQDVKSANLDLMSNKLVVETDTDAQAFTEKVKDCVNRIESKVKVVPLAGATVAKAPQGVHAHVHTHGEGCDCGHDHHAHDHAHEAAATVPMVGGQQYVLEGLTCAHCASVIEHEIQGWADVDAATLDLMKNTLTVSTKVAPDAMFERIKACVASVESGVTVLPKAQVQADTAAKGKKGVLAYLGNVRKEAVRFAAAFAVLVAAVLLPEGSASTAAFVLSYLIVGLPVLRQAVRAAVGGVIFNEQMLMGVASLGAMAVGEYAEGVAVMLFYTLGELLQEIAVNRSKRSIASLLDLRPDTVRVQTEHGWTEVAPEEVAVGALIQVQPG